MSTLRGVWVRLGIMLALFLLFIRFVVHEPLSVVLPVMCGSVVVVLRLIRRAKRAALGSP